MRKAVLVTLVLGVVCGCRFPTKGARYSRDDGASTETAVLIRGANDEQTLVAAEQKWILQRFPSAVIEHRGLAFDPLTGMTFGSTPANARAGYFCDEIEFRTSDGQRRVAYFAYDPSNLRAPPEDLTLLYRCIELLQNREIRRGITVDELRSRLTKAAWVEGENLVSSRDNVSALLSSWTPPLSLYSGSPPPLWRITFTIRDGVVIDYCLAKDRGK